MAGDRRVLLANSIYHLANDGAVTVIAGQITILQATFGFGAYETGVLVGAALVVTALAQVVFGIMSDRRDPSKFLPIGIVILGAGTIFVAASQTFTMLLVFIALARIGASFYHPVGIAWVGREFAGVDLDHSMGFQSSFGDAGVVLGMASAAVLGVWLGWQSPFLAWGAINLLAVAVGLSLARGHPSPPPPASPLTIPEYFGVLRDVRLWLLPLALGGASYNVMANFGPLLLYHTFGVSGEWPGVSIAVWILVGTFFAFYFGRISVRFGRYRVLIAAYAGIGLSGLVSAVAGNVVLVLVSFWILGAGIFLTYPAVFALAAESSHRQLRGAAFGIVFFVQLIGGALGVYLAGFLATAFGADLAEEGALPFWTVAAFGFLGATYLAVIRRRALRALPASAPRSTS